MTKRNEQFENLSAYLDGELSPDQRVSVDKDIKSDGSLAKELQSLSSTKKLIGQLPKSELSSEFSNNVVKILKAKQLASQDQHLKVAAEQQESPETLAFSQSKSIFSIKRYLATAAALILTGLVTVYFSYEFKANFDTIPHVDRSANSKKQYSNHAGQKNAKLNSKKSRKGSLKSGWLISQNRQTEIDEELLGYLDYETLAVNSEGNVCNIDVYTDDIEASKKQIAQILKANDVTVVPENQNSVLANQAKAFRQTDNSANYAEFSDADEIAFVVNGTPVQQKRIAKEINSQVVSQLARNVSQIDAPIFEVAVNSPGYVEKIIKNTNFACVSDLAKKKRLKFKKSESGKSDRNLELSIAAKDSNKAENKKGISGSRIASPTNDKVAMRDRKNLEKRADYDESDSAKPTSKIPGETVATRGNGQAKRENADKCPNIAKPKSEADISKENECDEVKDASGDRDSKTTQSEDIFTGTPETKSAADEIEKTKPIQGIDKGTGKNQQNRRVSKKNKKLSHKSIPKKSNQPKPMLIRIRFRKRTNSLNLSQQKAAKLAESNYKLLKSNKKKVIEEINNINRSIDRAKKAPADNSK